MNNGSNLVLIALLLGASFSASALDWSGTSRLAHQRWTVGDGDDAEDRKRESIRLRLMGSHDVGNGFSANVRFNLFTHEFHDGTAGTTKDKGDFDRAYINWRYGDNGVVAFGLLGTMHKHVGDLMRSNPNGLPGVTWMHNIGMGDWEIFLGASRFRMQDTENDSEDPIYYLAQAGVEGKAGMFGYMFGVTNHIYSSADGADNALDIGWGPNDNHNRLEGMELFGRLMGSAGGLDWRLYASMFDNGHDDAKDESDTESGDTKASLYGVGLTYGNFMLGYDLYETGMLSINRTVAEDDWCGPNYTNGFTHFGAAYACSASRITLSYDWMDNLMPKLEMVSAERDKIEVDRNGAEKDYSMTRLSLNLKF